MWPAFEASLLSGRMVYKREEFWSRLFTFCEAIRDTRECTYQPFLYMLQCKAHRHCNGIELRRCGKRAVSQTRGMTVRNSGYDVCWPWALMICSPTRKHWHVYCKVSLAESKLSSHWCTNGTFNLSALNVPMLVPLGEVASTVLTSEAVCWGRSAWFCLRTLCKLDQVICRIRWTKV